MFDFSSSSAGRKPLRARVAAPRISLCVFGPENTNGNTRRSYSPPYSFLVRRNWIKSQTSINTYSSSSFQKVSRFYSPPKTRKTAYANVRKPPAQAGIPISIFIFESKLVEKNHMILGFFGNENFEFSAKSFHTLYEYDFSKSSKILKNFQSSFRENFALLSQMTTICVSFSWPQSAWPDLQSVTSRVSFSWPVA